MGKGGTKFIAEAIPQRAGRNAGNSSKDMKKAMEVYKRTGKYLSIVSETNIKS